MVADIHQCPACGGRLRIDVGGVALRLADGREIFTATESCQGCGEWWGLDSGVMVSGDPIFEDGDY
jgi:hypothetical protein